MSAAVPRGIVVPDEGGPEPDERTLIAQKYALVREIGRGGMGVVHEAINTWTHRRVALKLLHPALPAVVRRRLFEEARTTSRLSHPNVVDVLDMGAAEDGSLFLVQELLEGEDLHDHLARVGRLAPSDALAIFLPVIDALARAHELGIVHRDVKPSNIVLARDPRGALVPKLVDFGIAKRLDTALDRDVVRARITVEGTLLGTPHYMAPEQIADDDVGPPADVWSIGVCLHEALTGRAPFESPQLSRLLREIRRFDPSDARVLAGVPDALAAPIRAALARDPDARPSMRALANMLSAAIETSEDDPDPTVIELRTPIAASDTRRAVLRVGVVLGARAADTTPLRDALRTATDCGCDVAPFASYAALVDAVGEGEVDLAWLPPVAYVRAARLGAVKILVSIERDERAAYASALLGRAGISSYERLEGRRAVWVDAWSTAGYVVPRELMHARGHDPDLTLRSQGFVGSYDAVLEALASGAADVGAAFCTVDESGAIVGRPWSERHGVEPIEVSAPIPGDTFCASSLLPDDRVDSVRASLLDPRASSALARLVGARRFAAGDPARYQAIEHALIARDGRTSASLLSKRSG